MLHSHSTASVLRWGYDKYCDATVFKRNNASIRS